MLNANEALQLFLSRFGGTPEGVRAFHAPGRVNLIGEHTDYNGGYVFPAALTFGTWMLLRPRGDRVLSFATTNFPVAAEVSLDDLSFRKEHDWINYPKGVLVHLASRGFSPSRGYDVLYAGEIPNGAGLSSSASIEVVTGYGFQAAEGREVDRIELALVAQEAENRYMGVNCGIMDQFSIAMGRQNHAIKLRCSDLAYELAPFSAAGHKLVIGNTNKRRGLVDSAYNERRAQCEQAVADLRAAFPALALLGEIDARQFEANAHLIADETVRKRARHVISENDRVLQSVEALKAGDLERFGRLMIASHDSLRDLYEVTGPELDAMVEEALKVDGTVGSRMTGAGFGGCTVSLVREDRVDAFVEQVGSRYEARTGLKPDFYVADIGDGVREIPLNESRFT
ncbi:galactokinase [Paenibacillus thermoaerophilus]|uniref:Galactokinase n=1 Tax=Paenibacillus thermoaerophilus TaxID=1215385 RepID=A0ABW2V7Y9_9BACL|nr:galactokinase [Paenibacillus thermoaerophilus]